MSINKEANEIIRKLDLQPHPEGGYFRETYRSKEAIEEASLPGFENKRNFSTCIYFLLTSDTFSAFHKIKQDEIWHFYDGSPIRLHTISEEGRHAEVIIGKDFAKGQVPQYVVPGGHWFGATVAGENTLALVGCTVSPGFDFKDFTLAERQQLQEKFPQHTGLIAELTHS
ncbi:cupin domain-containing protein [Zunongwangia sp. F363]|uniref:Cupin domain-containing protein n=1 Tax=Autumnicola tepida TaxID=3075595 RepID=A0ABU3CCU4_9FLAO|nr:cupin domain-containing protein [Zunongwangia sp. F363]MDT0644098.1 cupin domain-containing protein [Zunongwangia sp. F363]